MFQITMQEYIGITNKQKDIAPFLSKQNLPP